MMPETHSPDRRAMRAVAMLAAATLLLTGASSGRAAETTFSSRWNVTPDRIWIGPEYWANPMEDWAVRDGRIACTSAGPGRSVHLLTHQLSDRSAAFEMRVRVSLHEGRAGAAGFDVAVTEDINDYRGNCIWGSGIPAVLATDGTLQLGRQSQQVELDQYQDVLLTLTGTARETDYQLALSATAGDKALGRVSATFPHERIIGNVALLQNPPALFAQGGRRGGSANKPRANATFRFADWRVAGEKFDSDLGHRFGPILWSMYSVSHSRSDDGYVMKLTALLPPVGEQDAHTVALQFRNGQTWQTAGEQPLHEDAYTATFRIPNWDAATAHPFRLVYKLQFTDGTEEEHTWSGTIRAEPRDRPLVLGGLTCQEHHGFPYAPVAENLKAEDPDLLFFSGDQIYESSGGFGIIRRPADRAILNFLRKYYMFGWAFGDVMRDRPTLCIPDDHDVFQGNIWGEGGAAMPEGGNTSTDGGYIEPVRMVEVVHQTNTAHHPDLYDPTPVKQGMSVYYGDMVWGRVSFAIIADRQFKSAPGRVDTGGGRADHLTDPSIDVASLDKPGLELLGERQEAFLKHWVQDWREAEMKVLLSETVFANAATHHGGPDNYLIADLDSGGWPQTARNRALRILRKGFPLHVNGDQHLTTVIHYGADAQRDCFWSFCTPAISVGYQRWWRPDEMGRPHANRPSHGLPNTGEYRDGFGNPIYVRAVGNPEGSRAPNRYQQAHIKASGFGIIRINPDKRTYTLEAYRFLDAGDGSGKPEMFPGWPVVIHQQENYGLKPSGWLPKLVFRGGSEPVVRVIDQNTGELVYALRISGDTFQPRVFAPGTYTVLIGEDVETAVRVSDLTPREDPGGPPRTVALP